MLSPADGQRCNNHAVIGQTAGIVNTHRAGWQEVAAEYEKARVSGVFALADFISHSMFSCM